MGQAVPAVPAGTANGAEGAVAREARLRSAREARQNMRYINIQTQRHKHIIPIPFLIPP